MKEKRLPEFVLLQPKIYLGIEQRKNHGYKVIGNVQLLQKKNMNIV